MQKSKFLPRGRKDRTMVLVDIRETKRAKAADIFLQIRPGKDFELITILRAMIKGHEVGDDQIAETGLTRDTIEDLMVDWEQDHLAWDAHDLLAPVYEWFTEGFDTADLMEAKALLNELSEDQS